MGKKKSFDSDESEEIIKQRTPEETAAIMSTLLREFRPVSNRADADEFYTTSEIANIISNHTGEFIGTAEIYAHLLHQGYKHGVNDIKEIQWWLARVE